MEIKAYQAEFKAFLESENDITEGEE
jgi:hypothetical protein